MHRRESAKGDAKAPRWMSCGWSPSPTRAGQRGVLVVCGEIISNISCLYAPAQCPTFAAALCVGAV